MGVIMAIPMELITMGAGFVASAFTTLFKQAQDKRQQMFEMAMMRGEAQAKIFRRAREYKGSTGFHLTRRAIALAVIGTLLFSTMLAPIWFPDLHISVMLDQVKDGLFSGPHDVIKTYTYPEGIVITPVITHMVYAITGLFMGNQIAK